MTGPVVTSCIVVDLKIAASVYIGPIGIDSVRRLTLDLALEARKLQLMPAPLPVVYFWSTCDPFRRVDRSSQALTAWKLTARLCLLTMKTDR
jgi:hypothetical protein